MYPYTKEIDLGQAQSLKDQIAKGEIPDIKIDLSNSSNLDSLTCFNDLTFLYLHNNKVYLTALDYATHILKQDAPPEGWGYAAYELGSGMYDRLEFGVYSNNEWDIDTNPNVKFNRELYYFWNQLCFKLTDLARVEEQSEILQPATCCPKCYEVMTELKQEIAELEAKNKELADAGLNLAYNLATGSQSNEKNLLDRIAELEVKNKELQSDLHNTVKHNKSLGDNHIMEVYDLRVENDKLKNYIINQLLNN
jgi:hypothetical protein